LVGGGAREHAIAKELVDGGDRLYSVMSNENPGVAELADDYAIGQEKHVAGIVDKARQWGCTHAISGPEGPIAAGVTDALADAGVAVVSPSQQAGRVETDKSWMRDLMQRHGIPGRVRNRHFANQQGLREYVEELGDVAVKPVGLTGGKGVKVTGEHLAGTEEALEYANDVFTSGLGGGQVVIEEKLVGEEFTVQCFTDGDAVVPTPAVQDHKRAFEGDEGPNTGGMGSYSDADGLLPFLSRVDYEAAVDIVEDIVHALDDEDRTYRGTIYGQFMLTADGPRVVEINARFGDPEAMNTLPVLETPYSDVVDAMAEGTLDELEISFQEKATVCKYVVPEGYGDDPTPDTLVEIDREAIADTGAELFYASCEPADGGVRTTTSRTLALVGIADTIEDANEQAEQALSHVKGEAIDARHDIGTPKLVEKRVEHMRELGRPRNPE
jgi:phosphoribosylamine--glycine ligase